MEQVVHAVVSQLQVAIVPAENDIADSHYVICSGPVCFYFYFSILCFFFDTPAPSAWMVKRVARKSLRRFQAKAEWQPGQLVSWILKDKQPLAAVLTPSQHMDGLDFGGSLSYRSNQATQTQAELAKLTQKWPWPLGIKLATLMLRGDKRVCFSRCLEIRSKSGMKGCIPFSDGFDVLKFHKDTFTAACPPLRKIQRKPLQHKRPAASNWLHRLQVQFCWYCVQKQALNKTAISHQLQQMFCKPHI